MRLRRSRFFFLGMEEATSLDIAAFLQGEIKTTREQVLYAISGVSGKKVSLTQAQVGLLSGLSEDWVPQDTLLPNSEQRAEVLRPLVEAGLVITDRTDPQESKFLERERLLRDQQWAPLAASYFLSTQEIEGVKSESKSPYDHLVEISRSEKNTERFIQQWGAPPPPVAQFKAASKEVRLPLPQREGFFELLKRRKTTRGFESSAVLRLEDFALLMRSTFGVHGSFRLSEEHTILHKTSPSGGSLHPIEAYVLVRKVEDLPAGLYHYHPIDHSVRLLRPLESEKVAELAKEICGSQLYAAGAHFLVLLSARWLRNFWKYRKSQRTLGVVLMDAGHLSQTFYLAAAELGLGAFYTAAIDAPRAAELIDKDLAEEGPLGVLGCGVPSRDEDLGIPFERHEPSS